uniref:Uncharacterized protein n=1 Tax=Caenorhabditis japonica TaxID=281687 RepID=A0A8R1DWB4_CAEJA
MFLGAPVPNHKFIKNTPVKNRNERIVPGASAESQRMLAAMDGSHVRDVDEELAVHFASHCVHPSSSKFHALAVPIRSRSDP